MSIIQIVIAIIAIVTFVRVFQSSLRDLDSWWFSIMLSVFLSSLAIVLCHVCVIPIRGIFDTRLTQTNLVEIVSMGQGNLLGGQFSLGSGYVKEERYFFYYAKCGDGSLQEQSTPSGQTFIFQDENETPHVTWTTTYKIAPNWLKTGIDDVLLSKDGPWYVHVPSNTVIKEFKVR